MDKIMLEQIFVKSIILGFGGGGVVVALIAKSALRTHDTTPHGLPAIAKAIAFAGGEFTRTGI